MVSEREGRAQFAAMSSARKELTALFEAAKAGDVDGMVRVVSAAAGGSRAETLFGFRDGIRRHVLHFAVLSDSSSAVAWVVDLAPDLLDEPDDTGVTPLALAAGHAKMVAVKQLITAGAGAVQALLELGANVDAADKGGLTPIVLAAAAGSEESIIALAEAGADAGLILGGGATVVHICAERGLLAALHALCASDVGKRAASSKDSDFRTAAGVALDAGNSDCVDYLVFVTNSKRPEPAEPKPAEIVEAPKRERVQPDATARAAAAALKDSGNAFLSAKNYEQAEEAYGAAIALDATEKAFFSNRCAARLELAKEAADADARGAALSGALADADECVDIDVLWPKGHFRRGQALAAKEEFEEAANAYWEAVLLDKSNASLRATFKAAVDQGREHKAKAEAQRAAQRAGSA
ncbi:ankyrin repeat-containing domain protein [Pelagophyceae sp. CCMP2097]|nr:ankyrin repeat-containing domain protein [Pelagophyceae sp. CCMP2097]